MNTKRDYRSFDLILAILVVALSLFGILLIASATNYKTNGLSTMVKGQIVWVVTGIIIMLVVAFIDFRFICKFYVPYYFVNILLLIIALLYGIIFGIGIKRNIYLPGGLGSIQPSEFSKIFMIIFLSKFLDRNKEKINSFKFLGIVIGFTLVPVLLIQMQPSLSASLVTIFIMCVMVFATKINYKYILVLAAIIIPVGTLTYYDIKREDHLFIDKVLDDYQIGRITTFLNPISGSNEYYQNEQALKAIGSGQLNGKGLFNHIVKVPEAENDFIFSVLAEQFGFIGCLIVLILILLIVYRCFIIANRSDIFYGKLIAIAVSGMIAFQVFVNVGVNIYLIPNTGMTFPFISSGGSSMWVSMASVGMVLSIGMTKTKSMFED